MTREEARKIEDEIHSTVSEIVSLAREIDHKANSVYRMLNDLMD